MARQRRTAAELEALAEELLLCRTVGHQWDPFVAVDRRRPAFGDLMPWLCVRCKTERHDIVSWVDGSLISRAYRHPEGYALAERHRRADFRVALLRRQRPGRRR